MTHLIPILIVDILLLIVAVLLLISVTKRIKQTKQRIKDLKDQTQCTCGGFPECICDTPPECRTCNHRAIENCSTCDIIHPHFR